MQLFGFRVEERRNCVKEMSEMLSFAVLGTCNQSPKNACKQHFVILSAAKNLKQLND